MLASGASYFWSKQLWCTVADKLGPQLVPTGTCCFRMKRRCWLLQSWLDPFVKAEITIQAVGAQGEGMDALLVGIEDMLQNMMQDIKVLVPYTQGQLLGELHQVSRACLRP